MQLEIIVLGKGIHTLKKKIMFVSFVDPTLYRDTQLTCTHTHSFSMCVDICREAERRWRKQRSWGKEDVTRGRA